MLDPAHIQLTRLVVELLVGPPIMLLAVAMIYTALMHRLHRRPSYVRRCSMYPCPRHDICRAQGIDNCQSKGRW